MKTRITAHTVTLWASENDTWDWATRIHNSWPCSALSGNRFKAEFDFNGLLDFTLNGKYGDDNVSGNELSAICADLLTDVLPVDHPAYFVTVAQFTN